MSKLFRHRMQLYGKVIRVSFSAMAFHQRPAIAGLSSRVAALTWHNQVLIYRQGFQQRSMMDNMYQTPRLLYVEP